MSLICEYMERWRRDGDEKVGGIGEGGGGGVGKCNSPIEHLRRLSKFP